MKETLHSFRVKCDQNTSIAVRWPKDWLLYVSILLCPHAFPFTWKTLDSLDINVTKRWKKWWRRGVEMEMGFAIGSQIEFKEMKSTQRQAVMKGRRWREEWDQAVKNYQRPMTRGRFGWWCSRVRKKRKTTVYSIHTKNKFFSQTLWS